MEAYEQYLSRIALDPWTACDICDYKVRREDLIRVGGENRCEECAGLTYEQRVEIVQRQRATRERMKTMFNALAPRAEDFR